MAALPPIAWPTVSTIQHVSQRWATSPDMFKGAELFPVEEEKYRNSPELIAWQTRKAISGMTRVHNMGSDPVRVPLTGVEKRSEYTAYFKEMITLDEESLTKLANLGTEDRTRRARRMVMDAMQQLRVRCATRKEWMRWEAIRGQIILNDDGKYREIDYEVPAITTVPSGVYWDNPELSDPMADLQDMARSFRGTGGARPIFWITQFLADLLSRNWKVRELIRGSGFVGQISNEQITGLLVSLTGGIGGIRVYDEMYIPEGASEPITFLNDWQITAVAQGPPGERFAEFASTPCIHNGGIDSPRGGDFYFLDDQTDKPNPKMDVCGGVYGIPVIYHPEWTRTWNAFDPENPYQAA